MANRALLVSVLTLAVAGCVSAPPPPQPPAPARAIARPAPPPPPPAPTDWRDAARTPGTWSWTREDGASVARYGLAGQRAVAVLSCDPASRTTKLWRNSAATTEPLLVVTTTGTRKVLSASAEQGGGVFARLAPRDPLLDAIAFSRGRFMLETPGNTPLYLPSWPELTRVIEDCRKG